MPTDAQRLGARLRDARKAAGLSQAELAEQVGLSVESVSRAERGSITPTVWTLVRFADVLRLDLAKLIRGAEPPPKKGSPRRPQLERVVRIIEELDDDQLEVLGDFLRSVARPRPATRRSAR
jgi:transcriptional regulator with XRE-family HTH domain